MTQTYETEVLRLKKMLRRVGAAHPKAGPHGPISPTTGACLGCLAVEAAKRVLMLPGLCSADLRAIADLVYRVGHAVAMSACYQMAEPRKPAGNGPETAQNRSKPPERSKSRLGRETTPGGRKGGS